MKRFLMLLALISLAQGQAHAQTFVLACPADWGAADNCGGCGQLIWSAPDANDKVQTSDRTKDAFQYWTRLGDLPASAPVSISTGKTEGQAATCAGITGKKTAGELLGAPVPNPPPVTPPEPGTGSVTLNWTTPLTNNDGSALTNLSGYRVEWFLSTAQSGLSFMVTSPGVLTYTVTGLVTGTYTFRVYSEAGTTESAPATLPNIDVIGAALPPPPTCDAAPANITKTIACPTGTTGSWTQTQGWIAAAYPVCWTAGAPTPASAPTGACTPPPPPPKAWKVQPNGTTTTRPAYEAVLPLTGTALVRGNQDGAIAVGKPCLGEVFKIGTTSYRTIANSDAVLASPTYAGRLHVAVCTLQ